MKYLIGLFLMFVFQTSWGGQNFAPVNILTGCDMSTTSCTSIGLDMNQYFGGSIEAVFTGSPSGTFVVEVSSDNVQPCVVGQANCPSAPNPGGNVVNWVTYTGSSESISAAGNFLWNLTHAGYRWVRLVYTKSSGTGSLSATFTGKGE